MGTAEQIIFSGTFGTWEPSIYIQNSADVTKYVFQKCEVCGEDIYITSDYGCIKKGDRYIYLCMKCINKELSTLVVPVLI